jgi:hypothetical protein
LHVANGADIVLLPHWWQCDGDMLVFRRRQDARVSFQPEDDRISNFMGLLRDFAKSLDYRTLGVIVRSSPVIQMRAELNGMEFRKSQRLDVPKHGLGATRIFFEQRDNAQANGPIHELRHILQSLTTLRAPTFEQANGIASDFDGRGAGGVKGGRDIEGGKGKAHVWSLRYAVIHQLAG